MKTPRVSDDTTKKLLSRFAEAHLKTKIQTTHIQRTLEQDEVIKTEAKHTWPEVCIIYKLAVDDAHNYGTL